MLVPPHSRHS